jgi:hypothetical protein
MITISQIKLAGNLQRMLLLVNCLLLFSTFLYAQMPRPNQSYVPPNGMVPDKETAIKIAEAVLTPIYGKEEVEDGRPFKAELVGEVWTIDSALHRRPGGNLHIEISKKNGCILRIIATE